AEASYPRALEIRNQLAIEHPEQFEFSVGLGAAYCNLGNLAISQGNHCHACSLFDRAESALRAVLRREPRTALAREVLRSTSIGRASALSLLSHFPEAVAALERDFEFDDVRGRDRIRLERAMVLARARDHSRAATEADTLAGVRSIPPGPLMYHLASVESLA